MQRGKNYITTPLIDTTSVVCEVNVFVPAVAKSCHADQGPVKLVAVQYMLSFGAGQVISFNHFNLSQKVYTPAAFMRSEHEIRISALVHCRCFVVLCVEICG